MRRTRRTLTSFTLVASLILAVTPGQTTPAGAAAESRCKFSMNVDIAPGISLTPNSGTFTSNGETGKADCAAGAGTIGIAGSYGTKDPDSCGGAFSEGNEGNGTFVLSAPTGSGPERVESTFTFVYGQLSTTGGVVAGTFESARFTGTFQLTPTAGDCFSAPVTKALVTGEGTLR
ncbi:MAG: hypothetical protein AB1679_14465 [Actinomycetota bacterium]|jgi:hypothetical protein